MTTYRTRLTTRVAQAIVLSLTCVTLPMTCIAQATVSPRKVERL